MLDCSETSTPMQLSISAFQIGSSSWTGESEGPVPGDQEVDGQIPADRLASKVQEREPTAKKQGTAETMGRTLQETAEPPHPDSPLDIPPAETEVPISCYKPSKAVIKKVIMTLRSGKAAGPDEIPAEAIKAEIETAVNMLQSLFSKIWEKEEATAQWKEGITIKLPKKRRPWGLQKLSRDHALVSASQGSQQGST